jgi:peptidoglycan hydrolase-like protein with peptidoglycan-binding domain
MSHPVLRVGSRGSHVVLCQMRLTVHGNPCTPDGIFGPQTANLVTQFQRSSGLGADGVVGPRTWAALLADPKPIAKTPPGPLPTILRRIQSLGHEVVWEGDWHLNLFGIRSRQTQANSFDDTLGCAYTVNGMWRVHYWPGTTDPGTYWLQNPSRVEGTAILVAGQYKDCWQLGLHNGQYEALVQRAGAVRVYRDGNRDQVLNRNPATIQTGYFGINIHRASVHRESTEVDRWSAGCQVFSRPDAFDEMMGLARRQVSNLGRSTFTYTLLDEW